MKKILSILVLIMVCFCLSISTTFAAEEPTVLPDWIVPTGYEGRVSVTQGEEGIVIDQLVQGTPVNHAVAIAAPITGTNSIEVEFKITSEEYVQSGRLANDVWTGIGFMGKPVFINWMNSEAKGYAKDSPGLFTRFFNYAGDLKLITDIYCGGYVNDNTKPDETVDTWTLLDCSADASASDFVTMKLVWEEVGGKTFYNLYINGVCKTSGGEFSSIEPTKVFPDGKIYVEIAMNTQAKETNANTQVIVKRINDTVFAQKTSNDEGDGESKSGCGSSIAMSGLTILTLLSMSIVCSKRK